ncbi:hypothetical protein A4A49_07016 [Nicotiana attenuata]|uniref:Uncharacterized protein n=1 Tax=Nicotiana attenuata TaxID=49451 RepID=A0A1J6IVT8_NICAT|nr:hypothetical protein A4A49_07016 [Nicotiana attenuata]
MGATSEGMTHELPPQQVGHDVEGDGSASGHLDVRMDLTEAGLAVLNHRLEVVEGNFSSLESTALEELGDVKEALDLLTEEHKEGLTNLELKLMEAVSALHEEVESLKQQLEAAKLASGTSAVTVGHGEEGDGSASGHLDMRMDLTEAGLAALNRRLEVVEGNFSSIESTTLEELGDVKEALDLLTEEHKEGLTNLELKLTEAVSALHEEVESLKQQLEAAKLADGTGWILASSIEDFTPVSMTTPTQANTIENKDDAERWQSSRAQIFITPSAIDKKIEAIIDHQLVRGKGWGNSSVSCSLEGTVTGGGFVGKI